MTLASDNNTVLATAKHHSDKKHSVRYDVFAQTTDGKEVQIGAMYWPREHGPMPDKILIIKKPTR